MTPREFFYLVATMRDAQRNYFNKRSASIDEKQRVLRACRALENEVDNEIRRVKGIVENNAI